eukprot:s44_g43.t1
MAISGASPRWPPWCFCCHGGPPSVIRCPCTTGDGAPNAATFGVRRHAMNLEVVRSRDWTSGQKGKGPAELTFFVTQIGYMVYYCLRRRKRQARHVM